MSATPTSQQPSRVAEGLAAWASREPHAVALADDGGVWLRHELDELVASLAGAIRERRVATGIPDDAVVPLFLRADRWSVVALLAALHAGVPFAPLDADTPVAVRAAALARLGDPSWVIVTGDGDGKRDGTDALHGLGALDVRTARGRPVPPQPVRSDSPATIVFTSGSTGAPKGVVFGWGLWDALVAEAEAHRVTGDDGRPGARAVCLPMHWVAGMRSLGQMATGAPLFVADPSAGDPAALFARLERAAPAHVSFPPALAGAFARHAPAGRRLESVRSVSLGGLSVSGADARALRAVLAPGAFLRTVYGASETGGIGVVGLAIAADDELPDGVLPLGRPGDPDRVRLEPVVPPDWAADGPSDWPSDWPAGGDEPDVGPTSEPDGEVFELIVRGVVALGYLDDPAATGSRFGTDADGTRWWRSGDLVRVLPDGLLVLVGRRDDVVKVNGKLAAPAEPERVLSTMPAVREVAVVATSGAHGDRLVGHVVVDDGIAVGTVREWCTGRLPSHLVPSSFVRHDALPRLPTGKVDRLSLVRTTASPWRDGNRRIPGDALEAEVCQLAQEVLGPEAGRVFPDDDLWLLGLDSLGAVELAEACVDLGFGPFDPVATPEHLTPALIADELRRADRTRPQSTVVWRNADGGLPPVFAIPGAGGTSLGFRHLAHALGDDQPLVVVEARGLRNPSRVDRTIGEMGAHAARAVTEAAPTGALRIVGHSVGGAIAYETGRLLAAEGRDVSVVLVDARLSRRTVPSRSVPGTARRAATPAVPAPMLPPMPGSAGPARRSVMERASSARRLAMTHVRSFVPGPPDNSPERFNAFTLIGARAIRRFRPTPADLPVVLLYVEGSRAPSDWRAHLPAIECIAVGGDHHSVLAPPHVAAVARRLVGPDPLVDGDQRG